MFVVVYKLVIVVWTLEWYCAIVYIPSLIVRNTNLTIVYSLLPEASVIECFGGHTTMTKFHSHR